MRFCQCTIICKMYFCMDHKDLYAVTTNRFPLLSIHVIFWPLNWHPMHTCICHLQYVSHPWRTNARLTRVGRAYASCKTRSQFIFFHMCLKTIALSINLRTFVPSIVSIVSFSKLPLPAPPHTSIHVHMYLRM